MLISWLNVFQFLLTILSLILGYYLYSTKRCFALSVYFFCLAAHTSFRMVADIQSMPLLADLSNSVRFIYAPLVYFSIRELLYMDFRYSLHHTIHLAPFGLALISVSFLTVEPGILSSLVGILIVIYLIASYRLLFQRLSKVSFTKMYKISNKISNDNFAQCQTRCRFIHAVTSTGRNIASGSPPIRLCVVFCANLMSI